MYNTILVYFYISVHSYPSLMTLKYFMHTGEDLLMVDRQKTLQKVSIPAKQM